MRPDLDAIRKENAVILPFLALSEVIGDANPVALWAQQATIHIDALLTYVEELETSLNDVLEVTE